MTYMAKRAVALILAAIAIAFAIAAMVDIKWVEQADQSGLVGTYHLGLYKWKVLDTPGVGSSPKYDYSERGMAPWIWNENLCGSQSKWENAGKGALALGAIGVILAGLALLLVLVSLAKREFTKAAPAFLAFLSGVSFLLGALIFEGMRPSWGGDIGYEHPMGLYLGAGIVVEVAALLVWSADFVPVGKEIIDNRA